MRNTNKKGFTIVELVIVIAVIAILAAVMIPTIASLVNKANQSADEQAVTGMNKILVAAQEAPANVDEVVALLIANDYKGDLSTYFGSNQLAWVKSENVIVLVENDVIVYPKNYAGKDLAYEVINPMATSADDLAELTAGKEVFVGGDIAVEDGLSLESAGEYKVNLNNNTLASSDYVGSWVADGKLVVSNGVIDATTSSQTIAVYAAGNGEVELNNVQIYANSGVNPVQCYGGKIVLNNVIATQYGSAETAWYNSAIQVANHITQNASGTWYFDGGYSEVVVDGGVYTAKRAIQMSAPGGTIVINDGTFTGTEAVINADYNQTYASQGATYSIVINGGTFNGAVKINNANISCVINGGTFTVNPETIANVTVTGAIRDNGNGTWTVYTR